MGLSTKNQLRKNKKSPQFKSCQSLFTTYRRVCLIFITFFLLLHRLFFGKNLSWGSFQFWPFSCFQTTLYSVNLKTELFIEEKLRAFHKYWKILSPNKESNRTPYIILRSNTLPPSHRGYMVSKIKQNLKKHPVVLQWGVWSGYTLDYTSYVMPHSGPLATVHMLACLAWASIQAALLRLARD